MSRKPRQSTPVRMLIDPCVWSDLVEDPATSPLIDALEDLVGSENVALVVTPLILGEFAQDKPRLIEDSKRSTSSTRKRVREAPESFRNPRKTRTVIEELSGLEHQFVNLRDRTVETVERIERLLAAAEPCDITDAVKIRASERGIEKKAPFHRQRNGMNDAILIETYAAMARDDKGGQRFAFVTHNVKDFSDPTGNQALPHPDLAHLFAGIRSRYFITLGEAL
jgi:PIN domain-containing protein